MPTGSPIRLQTGGKTTEPGGFLLSSDAHLCLGTLLQDKNQAPSFTQRRTVTDVMGYDRPHLGDGLHLRAVQAIDLIHGCVLTESKLASQDDDLLH